MKSKRLISILLAVLMLMTMLPLGASAKELEGTAGKNLVNIQMTVGKEFGTTYKAPDGMESLLPETVIETPAEYTAFTNHSMAGLAFKQSPREVSDISCLLYTSDAADEL